MDRRTGGEDEEKASSAYFCIEETFARQHPFLIDLTMPRTLYSAAYAIKLRAALSMFAL